MWFAASVESDICATTPSYYQDRTDIANTNTSQRTQNEVDDHTWTVSLEARLLVGDETLTLKSRVVRSVTCPRAVLQALGTRDSAGPPFRPRVPHSVDCNTTMILAFYGFDISVLWIRPVVVATIILTILLSPFCLFN